MIVENASVTMRVLMRTIDEFLNGDDREDG